MNQEPSSSVFSALQGDSFSSEPAGTAPLTEEANALLALDRGTGHTFTVTHAAEALLVLVVALVPLLAIAYLELFQDPSLRIINLPFHELAIAVAIAEGTFITYVTWRCYLSSGEPFLRWLTLSFLSFTLIYAPHGIFTRMADDHLWLFLFFGPVSRFAMAACIFIGLRAYGKPADAPETRHNPGFWGGCIAFFLAIDLIIGIATHTLPGAMPALRLVFEYGALAFSIFGIILMLARRHRSPLMLLCALALAYFAQSSFGFVLAKPWDHLWWLSHAISAGGFLILSYGVLHAYHTTRSFSLVFGHEELINALRAAKRRADEAVDRLRAANEDLARLAATDPLTGVANRRHFIARSESELTRSKRSGMPLSLLALDLDHFKRINDSFGHETGDRVLQHFCDTVGSILRPSDLLGRLGGEEFMVLLPEADAGEAMHVAERIRHAVMSRSTAAGLPEITTSIGVACCRRDEESLNELFRIADDRLYRAKHLGRNRVVGTEETSASESSKQTAP
jgi:diguanylate cyclase (GGDEF)-like protein